MDLLHYEIILKFLFNLEIFCVKSSDVCRHAICTFLISSLSVGLLISVVGQLDDPVKVIVVSPTIVWMLTVL